MVRFVAFPRFGKSMPACRDFFLFRLITYRTGVSLFAFFRASRLFGYNAAVPNMFGFAAYNVVPAGRRMPMVRFVAFPRFGKSMLVFADTLIPADRTGIARMFGFIADNVVPAGSYVPMVLTVARPYRRICMFVRRFVCIIARNKS